MTKNSSIELTAKDKIQKICDAIKNETLEPAKQQANEIVENAKIQAEEIIRKAKKDGEKYLVEAKGKLEQEKQIFQAALDLAAQQSLDRLKEQIEKKLFNENLKETIINATKDPQIVANLINAVIKALETEKLDADLSIIVARQTNPDQLMGYLIAGVVEKLKQKPIQIGDFESGVKILLKEKQITLDVSNEALVEMVSSYLRPDFRKKVFKIL